MNAVWTSNTKITAGFRTSEHCKDRLDEHPEGEPELSAVSDSESVLGVLLQVIGAQQREHCLPLRSQGAFLAQGVTFLSSGQELTTDLIPPFTRSCRTH